MDSDTSRRNLLLGVGTGVVASLGIPAALAQQSSGQQSGGQQSGMERQPSGEPTAQARNSLVNPAEEYPRPPFAKQQQPWPGLDGQMNPVPESGERSYRGAGRLTGRRALITGGDSGIGRAVAIAFAREGADVAINYLPQEEPDARDVVHWIREAGRKAVPIPGDIRNPAFCQQLVDTAVSQLGGLDILVNNAGRQIAHNIVTEITDEDFDNTFKTNVYAMFWITRAAVPHMPPGAAIVNTASINAYEPDQEIIDYAATKGAIMIFSKGLAKQLAPKGIRVNAVAPGPVWTPLQVTGGQPTNKIPQFGASTPMKRPAQPAELAPLYVALASDDMSYTTGQVFGATGGSGGP